ncbi:MAG: septum formation initiator family protein [Lachnospiraceae bacterium]|nr:septum formation initiator family protein [Lachnospiraceae bacterium]MDY4971111.1 septum formation initiator family protein [Lachnospiraceae bacterium]
MDTNKRKPRRKYARRISAKEQKKRLRLTFTGIGLILILAAGILGFQTSRLNQQKAAYTAQVEQLQSDIEDEQERQQELLKKKIEVSSDAYIESEARKRLGLVREDEVLIKRK